MNRGKNTSTNPLCWQHFRSHWIKPGIKLSPGLLKIQDSNETACNLIHEMPNEDDSCYNCIWWKGCSYQTLQLRGQDFWGQRESKWGAWLRNSILMALGWKQEVRVFWLWSWVPLSWCLGNSELVLLDTCRSALEGILVQLQIKSSD